MCETIRLSQRGLSICHLHVATLKPFAHQRVVEAAAKAMYGVVTMENHSVLVGLCTATSELLCRYGVGARLSAIGLNNTFSHGASHQYLMKEYGFDAMSFVQRVEAVVGERFGGGEEKLADARVSEFSADGQLEAL